jgi:hypothetical protein
VLSGKLRLRFSRELEWTNRLLSERQYLRWSGERCASHNCDCLSTATDGHCLRKSSTSHDCCCQQSTEPSTRRLLRNNHDGWSRPTQSGPRRLWNDSHCSRSSRPESVRYWNGHLRSSAAFGCCKNVQPVMISRAGTLGQRNDLEHTFHGVMSYDYMYEHDGLDGL